MPKWICGASGVSADEFGRLVEAARVGATFREMTGPDRALLYTVAANTGLRAAELASLSADSFDMEADPPTITVEASYSNTGGATCCRCEPICLNGLVRCCPDSNLRPLACVRMARGWFPIR